MSLLLSDCQINPPAPPPPPLGNTHLYRYEIRLEDFIDLDTYPIHDLRSPVRKELVRKCRGTCVFCLYLLSPLSLPSTNPQSLLLSTAELQKTGCCLLTSFITPGAVTEMAAEATRLMKERTRQCESFITPYLAPPPEEFHGEAHKDHPRNFLQRRTQVRVIEYIPHWYIYNAYYVTVTRLYCGWAALSYEP